MRKDSLEGVRGAAALLVVLFHAGVVFPDSGYLAVDLFFVLSGVVISGNYGSRLMSGADVRAFVVRRFGRLWPVHIATTILYFATFDAMGALAQARVANVPPLGELVALLTMTQGLVFDHLIANQANWSAGDEFYVYLAFAAVCMVVERAKARVAAFAALALVGYALCIYASVVHDECLRAGSCFSMAARFGGARCVAGFFLGALIAEYRDVRALRFLARRVPQLIVAALTLLFASVTGTVHGLALVAPFMFAAFVASLMPDLGPVARFFRRPLFQYLGKVSYSLYLGHSALMLAYVVAVQHTNGSPRMMLAAVFGFLAASFALAHVLNRYVETPCRVRFNAWAEKDLGRRSLARPSPL